VQIEKKGTVNACLLGIDQAILEKAVFPKGNAVRQCM